MSDSWKDSGGRCESGHRRECAGNGIVDDVVWRRREFWMCRKDFSEQGNPSPKKNGVYPTTIKSIQDLRCTPIISIPDVLKDSRGLQPGAPLEFRGIRLGTVLCAFCV